MFGFFLMGELKRFPGLVEGSLFGHLGSLAVRAHTCTNLA